MALPRPEWLAPIPDYFMMETRAHLITDPPVVGSTIFTGDVRNFLLVRGRHAQYIFDRVKAWTISIGCQIACPNTVDGEYQTIEIGAVWDRQAKGMTDERTLRSHDVPLASTNFGNGRDLILVDGPATIVASVNLLKQYNTGGGLLLTTRADLQLFFGGFAYVPLWNPPPGSPPRDNFNVRLMLDVILQGNSWFTLDTATPGTIDPPSASSYLTDAGLDNIHAFVAEGTSTTDFRIRGNFYGGDFSAPYGTTTWGAYLQDYHFMMTPLEWWEYPDEFSVPFFDSATGEPL